MEYPNKCCRCGFCCLTEQCPVSISLYGDNFDVCPALVFNGDVAACLIVKEIPGLVPVGDGCCIKARAYKDGVEYDFASLSPELKRQAVNDLRRRLCYGNSSQKS